MVVDILPEELLSRMIKAGKLADIIIVDGNPLDNIQALKKIRHVLRGGKPVLKNGI